MLAKTVPHGIGPDVPSTGTSDYEPAGYERSMLRAMKNTLAGRSPNLRIK
jgi:hypothetical protein